MYKRTEISNSQLALQQDYCEKIRALHNGKMRYAFVDTYGCQQNESDSEILRGWLVESGYTITPDDSQADIIVINTCAVREHAEMRALGNVGALIHAKNKNPDLIICVGGCMPQQETRRKKIEDSFRMVDLVFGPHELWCFPELVFKTIERHGKRGNKGRLFMAEPSDGVISENLPRQRDGNVKAWLSIMYGCDNFCSYCIVPYVRGRERSRKPEDILAEFKQLVNAGYKDITLLGQNVNSYGKGLEEDINFPGLLRMLDQVDGDYILRFMTSHPKDATEELFKTLGESRHCAHHIHLPVQSGSDRILKQMNRHYNVAAYMDKVSLARKYMPDIVLTTDIIVGFPGETEEDFNETLSIVEKVRYDAMFTFIYSPRTGTPAAIMPDADTREEKQRRFDILLDVANRISKEKHEEYIGKKIRVLIDGKTDRPEQNLASRTFGGRLVHLSGSEDLIGSFAEVEITGASTWALFGKLIP